MKQIPIEQIYAAVENNFGWCTTCKDFTTSGIEPDAENCECESCGKRTVMGAENALLMGELE